MTGSSNGKGSREGSHSQPSSRRCLHSPLHTGEARLQEPGLQSSPARVLQGAQQDQCLPGRAQVGDGREHHLKEDSFTSRRPRVEASWPGPWEPLPLERSKQKASEGLSRRGR